MERKHVKARHVTFSVQDDEGRPVYSEGAHLETGYASDRRRGYWYAREIDMGSVAGQFGPESEGGSELQAITEWLAVHSQEHT